MMGADPQIIKKLDEIITLLKQLNNKDNCHHGGKHDETYY
jgi:hypothetical protein